MPRRIFAREIRSGLMELSEAEAHHVRNVLRLSRGEPVELFDDTGSTATGVVAEIAMNRVVVEVSQVRAAAVGLRLTILSALPKGDRADWMIEKLSELGVAEFMPLITARSIVEPPRANKLDRWKRIAIESAKQSHRSGVMTIGSAITIAQAIGQFGDRGSFVLTTQGSGQPITGFHTQLSTASAQLLVGPEGGWTDDESGAMLQAGLTPTRLTGTILRIETAAVAAAAIVASMVHAATGGRHT